MEWCPAKGVLDDGFDDLSLFGHKAASALVVERPRHGIAHILVLILPLPWLDRVRAGFRRPQRPAGQQPVKEFVLGDSLSAALAPGISAFPTQSQKGL